MDGAQARVQDAITKMVNSLDKDCLRKMQVDMYNCSAKCCQNQNASLEEVQSCIDRCSQDVNNAQTYLQNEIQNFQNRLQRCAMSCQDKLRDDMPAKPSEQDMQKGRAYLEKCVIECADSHVTLIPGLTKKMLETLKNKSY